MKTQWKMRVLWAAGLYNLAFAVAGIVFPVLPFEWMGLPLPNYPEQLQVLWLVIGLLGLGYLIAASDPVRHWPLVFLGFLSKVLAPLFLLQPALSGKQPWQMSVMVIPNDLIWWVPFGLLLREAYHVHRGVRRSVAPELMRMALRARSQHGVSLGEMSKQGAVLVIFLRHFGCTFCREALADLAEQREAIEAQGVGIALVHMADEEEAARLFGSYGLGDLPRVADTNQAVYRAFGLPKGTVGSLFGPKVWWRGFRAGLMEGHGLGAPRQDPFQMPGVFLVFHGEVIRTYRHQSAADRPDYVRLAVAEEMPELEIQ